MEKLKQQIELYNKEIFDNEQKRAERKEKSFKIINGSIPIILSAPHCVNQTRQGKIKQAEGETGAIVQILAKLTNCYAIYKTYNNNDDANYDIIGNLYKEELKDIIIKNNLKLLIDFHGAKNENKFDIDIGTDNGINIRQNYNVVEELKKCLEDNGVETVKLNEKFKASTYHTICKYIFETTNIMCIQLEISGRYRYIESLQGIEKLIKSLNNFINNIKEKI